MMHSRRHIIALKLCTTTMAENVTATLDLALQASGCDSATVVAKPGLLSDNGSPQIWHNFKWGSDHSQSGCRKRASMSNFMAAFKLSISFGQSPALTCSRIISAISVFISAGKSAIIWIVLCFIAENSNITLEDLGMG